MKVLKSTALLFLAVILLTSCGKKQNQYTDYNTLIASANDYMQTEQMTLRLLNTIFKVATDSVLITDGYNKEIDKASCVYQKDTVTDSVYFTISYGNWGVTDPYGQKRGGKILFSLDGNLSDSAARGVIEFEHFHYNHDSLVSQDFTIINSGRNSKGNLLFHVTAGLISLQKDSSRTVTWQPDYFFEWIKSDSTVWFSGKEQFLISGSSKITDSKGNDFSIIISDSARINDNYVCNWMQDGSLLLTGLQGFHDAGIALPPSGTCLNAYQLFIDDLRFDGAIE